MTRRYHGAALPTAFFLVMAAAGQSQTHSAGELEIVLTGFRTVQGELAIALFESAHDYENQSDPVRQAWLDVDGEGVVWVVSDLPPGHYAAVAFHDENGNRELDLGIFGIPKEPYGFSNNARAPFGPPRFDAAKFEIHAGAVARQQVRLR